MSIIPYQPRGAVAFGQESLYPLTLEEPTVGATMDAFIQEAYFGVGTGYADSVAESIELAKIEGTPIDEETFYSTYGQGRKYEAGMTYEAAQELINYDNERKQTQEVIAGATNGAYIAGMTTGFAAGLFEPKNLAYGVGTSLLATPVIGGVVTGAKSFRRVQQLRRVSEAALISRGSYGALAGRGGAEGLVSAALMEPSNRYSADILQQDYTMADSLWNVATSAVLGAGLGAAPKFVQDKWAKFKGRAPDIVAHEIDMATEQLVTGQRVDVTPVERLEVGDIAAKPLADRIDAVAQMAKYEQTPEFKTNFFDKLVTNDKGDVIKTADELNDYIQQKYGVETYVAERNRGDIYLSSIKTPEDMRGQGFGTAAMNDIVKYADSIGKRVALTPTSDFGGDIKRLKQFYKRFGFVENKGKNKDYSISETFYREPSIAKDTSDLQLFINESTQRLDAENKAALQKAAVEAVSPENDTAIDFNAARQIDKMMLEDNPEAEFKTYMDEVRQMRKDGLIDEAEFTSLQDAMDNLNEADLEAIHNELYACLTRG